MNRNSLKPNELSNEMKSSVKKRTIIGILMTIVVIPCVLLGGWFYLVLACLVIAAATYEVAKAPSHHLSLVLWFVVFITMYALVFWVMIKTNMRTDWKEFSIYTSFNQIWLSPIALAVMIAAYFIVIFFKKEFIFSDACYLIAMTLLLSLGFQAILFVRYIPFTDFLTNKILTPSQLMEWPFKYFRSSFLLYYILIAIVFNDMGAFFVGIFFGKHKMNPRISPKKTWEGFFGGVIISMIFSFSFAMIIANFNFSMLPNFDVSHWYWILLCSFILPFAGDLGDFAFSAVKRHFGIKDYSHILGPHGGVLDRIDSLLFGALAMAILITFINNGWKFYI